MIQQRSVVTVARDLVGTTVDDVEERKRLSPRGRLAQPDANNESLALDLGVKGPKIRSITLVKTKDWRNGLKDPIWLHQVRERGST